MSIKVIACPHPFTEERIERDFDAGTTYAKIVEWAHPVGFPTRAGVLCGDEPIGPERYGEAPDDGTLVLVRIIPSGDTAQEVGNKMGKYGGLGILLGILAIGASIFIGPGLLGAAFLYGGFGLFGTGLAVAATGGLVIMGANMYDSLTGAGDAELDNSVGIRGGRNKLDPWGAVPVILGTTLVIPPYGAKPYTEIGGTDGADQYLRMMFILGYGPMKAVQFKIGENLLATNTADQRDGTITVDGVFSGVDLEIKSSAGSMTLYPELVIEDQPSVLLTCPGGTPTEFIRTTPPLTTKIGVDITFNYGLVTFADDGTPGNRTVQVIPEYRLSGSGTWLALGTWAGIGSTTITKGEAKLKRFTCLLAGLAAGTYEVRMRRMTADSTDTKIRDQVHWSALRAFRAGDPVDAAVQASVVRVAIKIKASDQLNGIVDQLNCIASSVLPVYSGTGSGASSWALTAITNNPAAMFLYILRGATNPRPVPDDKIDYATIEEWYAFCTTKGLSCNTVAAASKPMRDWLMKIAGVGRATLTLRDGRYSIVIDNARSTPVQYFSPRNSRDFSGAKSFPEIIHGLKLAFVNSANGYAVDQCIVYDDGYNSGNATVFESSDLWGVSTYDQAWKQGRYMLAARRLRPEVFKLTVDVEHLICTRGDMVSVSHDVPMWGIVSGRIKSVTVDGSNNVLTATVDEALAMETGTTYAVKIRNNAGVGVSAVVTTVDGESYVMIFPTPIPAASGVLPGDLFMFGETSLETVDCLIDGIAIDEDLSATLSLVEYAPAIQTADTGTIPTFDSKITRPANFALEVVSAPEPIPAGPPGPEGPAASGANPPTNNVTNVVFTSSQNADGTVHVKCAVDYAQGTDVADGFFVYAKWALSAPVAFDYAHDPAMWKPIDVDGGYAWEGDFPIRTGGSGGAVIHYRFGAVAGSGSKLHTSGAVTPTGWDDKTFSSAFQFDANNYWDLISGILRVGDADNYLLVDPASGVAKLHSLDLELDKSYLGSILATYSLIHERLKLSVFDSNNKLKRYGELVGLPALPGILAKELYAEVSGPLGTWTGEIAYSSIADNYKTTAILPDGNVIVIFAKQSAPTVYYEQLLTPSNVVLSETYAFTTSYGSFQSLESMNGELILIRLFLGIVYERIRTPDGTWGDEVESQTVGTVEQVFGHGIIYDRGAYVIGAQNSGTFAQYLLFRDNDGNYSIVPLGIYGGIIDISAMDNGYILIVYREMTTNLLREVTYSPSGVISSPVTIAASTSGFGSMVRTLDGGHLLHYKNFNSPYYLYEATRSNAGVWSASVSLGAISLYAICLLRRHSGDIVEIQCKDSNYYIVYKTNTDGSYSQVGAGIIESGGNETTGYWEKSSTGKLEQWIEMDLGSLYIAAGGLYGSPTAFSWTFPKEFIARPVIHRPNLICGWAYEYYVGCEGLDETLVNGMYIKCTGPTSRTQNYRLAIHAIGFWK